MASGYLPSLSSACASVTKDSAGLVAVGVAPNRVGMVGSTRRLMRIPVPITASRAITRNGFARRLFFCILHLEPLIYMEFILPMEGRVVKAGAGLQSEISNERTRS